MAGNSSSARSQNAAISLASLPHGAERRVRRAAVQTDGGQRRLRHRNQTVRDPARRHLAEQLLHAHRRGEIPGRKRFDEQGRERRARRRHRAAGRAEDQRTEQHFERGEDAPELACLRFAQKVGEKALVARALLQPHDAVDRQHFHQRRHPEVGTRTLVVIGHHRQRALANDRGEVRDDLGGGRRAARRAVRQQQLHGRGTQLVRVRRQLDRAAVRGMRDADQGRNAAADRGDRLPNQLAARGIGEILVLLCLDAGNADRRRPRRLDHPVDLAPQRGVIHRAAGVERRDGRDDVTGKAPGLRSAHSGAPPRRDALTKSPAFGSHLTKITASEARPCPSLLRKS